MIFYYVITGKQSIERLEPLLQNLNIQDIEFQKVTNFERKENIKLFIWETTCEKELRVFHESASIINKMYLTNIIESKANLAILQQLMNCPTLQTFISQGSDQVIQWAKNRWSKKTDQTNLDWWVVKASDGNGGKDIWIINSDNYEQELLTLQKSEEYVIQKYVINPLLYHGKKFHFRCYGMITDTFDSFVYQNAFILTAGLDFNLAECHLNSHITNLSVNKRFPNHPGQIPCNLKNEYPKLYANIMMIWKELTLAAEKFMGFQRNNSTFEFFGFDIIADQDENCWLVEVNRLPGLESSSNNKLQEDEMYDEMMDSLLHIIFESHLHHNLKEFGLWEFAHQNNLPSTVFSSLIENQSKDNSQVIKEAMAIHMLKWKLFTKSHRKDILSIFNY